MSSLLGGGSSTTTGYRYYMSILMGLADSADDIVQIKVGGMVAWTGPLGSLKNYTGNSAVNASLVQGSLFGGDKGEGGVAGHFDFYDGNAGQYIQQVVRTTIQNGNEVATATVDGSALIAFPPVDKNADSSANAGAPTTGNPNIPITYVKKQVDVSEFRHAATFWWDGQICANNPYPKEWKFRVRRTNSGWDGDPWYPERAQIILTDAEALAEAATDAGSSTATQAAPTNSSPMTTALLLPEGGKIVAMNAAHIIYECLTNRNWGRGLSRALIDEPSFISAANWLYSEGFGLCLKWSKSDDLGTFLQTVIDTIGASLYTDRSTGLMVLKLIRDDYALSDLPVFDYNSGLIEIDDVDNSAGPALKNEVIVIWHSPISDVDRKVRAQNVASIQALQCTNSDTKTYSGLPTAQLAQRAAQRDLRASAYGIRSFSLKFDRRGFKIMPGMVFIVNAPDRNIGQMVLRCVALSDGTLDDGVITIQASQDVFALPDTVFTETQQSQFNQTDKNPQPVTYARAVEATYRDAVITLGATDAAALDETQTLIGDLPVAPSTLSPTFEIYTQTAGETAPYDGGIVGFPIYAQLAVQLGQYDTVLYLQGVSGATGLTFPFCALIDDEFLRVDDYDYLTGKCNVARGCVDSVPAPHSPNAIVWDYDTVASDKREYTIGEVVTIREQTITSAGFLDLAATSSHQIATVGRQSRPWPPCNVKINGHWSSDYLNITAQDLTLTWSNRNRLLIQDNLYGYDLETQTPEVNQTTSIRVRNMKTGLVIDQLDGITGTSFVYTQSRSIYSGIMGNVQFELFSIRDGVTSIFADLSELVYYPTLQTGGMSVGSFSLSSVETGNVPITGEMSSSFRLQSVEAGIAIIGGTLSSVFKLRAPEAGDFVPGGYGSFTIGSEQTGIVIVEGVSSSGFEISSDLFWRIAGGTMSADFSLTSRTSGNVTVTGQAASNFGISAHHVGTVS